MVVRLLRANIDTFTRVATRIFAVLILIQCGHRTAIACSCNRQTVTAAYAEAEIVFEATITAIHGVISNGAWPAGSVKFSVSRVWKGEVPSRFEMPAVQQTGSCLGFYKRLLKSGNVLLVYGRRSTWGPNGEQVYFTDACARTMLLKEASEDRLVLAKIHSPAK
jgi:hypothetical protein